MELAKKLLAIGSHIQDVAPRLKMLSSEQNLDDEESIELKKLQKIDLEIKELTGCDELEKCFITLSNELQDYYNKLLIIEKLLTDGK